VHLFVFMLFIVPFGSKLGPLNGPNCIPAAKPEVTNWGTFDGELCRLPVHFVWVRISSSVQSLGRQRADSRMVQHTAAFARAHRVTLIE